jgi:hypothetical protein
MISLGIIGGSHTKLSRSANFRPVVCINNAARSLSTQKPLVNLEQAGGTGGDFWSIDLFVMVSNSWVQPDKLIEKKSKRSPLPCLTLEKIQRQVLDSLLNPLRLHEGLF